MARTPLNEDLVHLYIMTSLYIQETDVVKVGIGKDPIKRAREVGGEVRFRTKTPQLRQITLYMEKNHAPAPILLIWICKGSQEVWF
jgi:hypothetical protein